MRNFQNQIKKHKTFRLHLQQIEDGVFYFISAIRI